MDCKSPLSPSAEVFEQSKCVGLAFIEVKGSESHLNGSVCHPYFHNHPYFDNQINSNDRAKVYCSVVSNLCKNLFSLKASPSTDTSQDDISPIPVGQERKCAFTPMVSSAGSWGVGKKSWNCFPWPHRTQPASQAGINWIDTAPPQAFC